VYRPRCPVTNTCTEKTTYVFNDVPAEPEPFALAPPPPPPPAPMSMPPPPPPQSVHYPPPQSVHYAQSVRSVSPSRHGHEVYEERIEESNHIGGPLTVLVPEHQRRREQHEERRVTRVERDSYERDTHVDRDSRSKRELEEEIRALEAERRMLKYERENEYEFVEKREPRKEVVRVEKDRKGRLALVRSAR